MGYEAKTTEHCGPRCGQRHPPGLALLILSRGDSRDSGVDAWAYAYAVPGGTG